MTRQRHALVSCGLLGLSWDSHHRAYQTKFHEMALAITNTESADACLDIFRAWSRSMRLCCGVEDVEQRVRAVHSDFHKGIRRAISDFFLWQRSSWTGVI